MTTIEDRLAERYGTRTSRSRRIGWWVVVAVVALTATGLLGWSTIATASRTVDTDTTGFSVEREDVVEISFLVTPPPGRSFACALEAQDVEHGVVGWKVVEYPVPQTRPVALTETLPTIAAATTGLVNSCWVT